MRRLRLRLLWSVIAGLSSVLSLAAAEPRTKGVALRVDPERTLVGLPVAMLVTIPIDPASLEEYEIDTVPAELLVTSEATGETAPATYMQKPWTTGAIDFSIQTHLPDRMIEIQIPLLPPGGQGWFADERFSRPGKYRLQLHILATEEGMPEDYLSSEATLEVIEPAGVDAEAWAWLHQARSRFGWSRREWYEGSKELVAGLTEKFPSSDYARYSVGLVVNDPRIGDAWLEKAIEISKGTWMEDYYRVMQVGRRVSPDNCDLPRDQRTACMAKLVTQVRRELLEIGKRTTSISVRHTTESARRRLKGQFGSTE